ncbi:MAG TPA: hypothetical protein VEX86_27655 [Longimicrobium sp.]|nr:hypothetical protein [Longimicrobium sp.]
MAEFTTEPYPTKPIEPNPWDPTCPACLSGIGPTPDDPIIRVEEPVKSTF